MKSYACMAPPKFYVMAYRLPLLGMCVLTSRCQHTGSQSQRQSVGHHINLRWSHLGITLHQPRLRLDQHVGQLTNLL